MPPTSRLTLILAASLASAACERGEEKAADQRTAGGEILPGSISDAMLPYDTVRSQPPLAPEAEASGRAKRGSEPKAEPRPAADAPTEAPAEPAEAPPAPSPAEE